MRAPWCVGATPCLVPNSMPFRMLAEATLSPLQVAACQGIFQQDYALLVQWCEKHPRVVRDLAGNAFSSSVCLATVLALLASMG